MEKSTKKNLFFSACFIKRCQKINKCIQKLDSFFYFISEFFGTRHYMTLMLFLGKPFLCVLNYQLSQLFKGSTSLFFLCPSLYFMLCVYFTLYINFISLARLWYFRCARNGKCVHNAHQHVRRYCEHGM